MDLSEFLRNQLIHTNQVHTVVESVEPKFLAYGRTLQALHTYLELTRTDDGELLPLPSKAIRAGETYSGVSRLARLLQSLGGPGGPRKSDRQLHEHTARPPCVAVTTYPRTLALAMNIVAGRAYHHQTPVFTSHIQSVIFRPYWNVPLTIQRNELVPQLAKHPGYLAENFYEILNARGQVILNFQNDQNWEQNYEGASGFCASDQDPVTAWG